MSERETPDLLTAARKISEPAIRHSHSKAAVAAWQELARAIAAEEARSAAQDAEIARLVAENEAMREALDWYADEANWRTDCAAVRLNGVTAHNHTAPVDADEGERARNVLAAVSMLGEGEIQRIILRARAALTQTADGAA